MAMDYTSIGRKLGALLGGGGGGSDGYEAAAKADHYASQASNAKAQARKTQAEADKIARALALGSDENMTRTAQGLQGIDPDSVDNNLNSLVRQNMLREGMGQKEMNAPDFDNSFAPGMREMPTTNALVAVLRNAQAGGDQNFDLGKAFGNIMKNQAGADLMGGRATPGQAAISGAALHAGQGGDPNKVIEAEALAKALAGGITPQALAMMKASPLFNSQGIGSFTGEGGQAFDVDQRNKVGMNDADNRTSATNNALDNRTSIANNALDNRTSRSNSAGGGAGGKFDKYKGFRDDIRSQYNLEYPLDITGARGKNAPLFEAYELKQIGRFNIDGADYYNTSNGDDAKPKAAPNARYQEYLDAFKSEKDPARRKRMTEFARSKGIVK